MALTYPSAAAQPLPIDAEARRRLSSTLLFRAVFACLFALGVTLVIIYLAPQIQKFRFYGYSGVFLACLLGNGTIVLPVPSSAVTFSMGSVLRWPLVGLVAGVGAALGETVGYIAGRCGVAILDRRLRSRRLQCWLDRHGMITLFVLSATPNPFTDLACIAAGAQRYSVGRFMASVWLGKTAKALLIAWAGAHSVALLLHYL